MADYYSPEEVRKRAQQRQQQNPDDPLGMYSDPTGRLPPHLRGQYQIPPTQPQQQPQQQQQPQRQPWIQANPWMGVGPLLQEAAQGVRGIGRVVWGGEGAQHQAPAAPAPYQFRDYPQIPQEEIDRSLARSREEVAGIRASQSATPYPQYPPPMEGSQPQMASEIFAQGQAPAQREMQAEAAPAAPQMSPWDYHQQTQQMASQAATAWMPTPQGSAQQRREEAQRGSIPRFERAVAGREAAAERREQGAARASERREARDAQLAGVSRQADAAVQAAQAKVDGDFEMLKYQMTAQERIEGVKRRADLVELGVSHELATKFAILESRLEREQLSERGRIELARTYLESEGFSSRREKTKTELKQLFDAVQAVEDSGDAQLAALLRLAMESMESENKPGA